MATAKRTPPIQIRLAAADHTRFDLCCRLEGKNRNELARKALLFYLEKHESDELKTFESPMAERLKKVEDRLAAIMAKSNFDTNKRLDALTNRLSSLSARIALDTGSTFMLMFRLLNKETREQVVTWASTNAFKRLELKLKHPEVNMQELMHWLEEEPGYAPNGRKA
ncbi:MAG TPA: hypothetical protein V6C97_00180 [Oculatellaceae cyanobacterium]